MTAFNQLSLSKVYASANTQEILITEVMPMSQISNDAYEYIELYNNSDRSIDLKDYKLPLQNIDITTSKIISPKGIVVVCTNGSTSLEAFNSFYGTSLTADKYLTLPFINEVFNNSSSGNIVLSKDDSNLVVVGATFSTADFELKKSVTYKYSPTGYEMILKGQKQSPSVGNITADQVPDSGIKVTGITLDKNYLTMEINQTASINATISPATATNKAIVWKTSNEAVAQVNQSGIVTSKAEGFASITATTVDGGFTASCTVVVSKVPVTGITLDKSSAALEVGKGIILNASTWPQNATNKSVKWQSSNRNVASVDSNGIVIGISAGEATITATAVDGNFSATCKVTVTAPNGVIPVSGIKLDKTNVTMTLGQVIILEETVSPTNATNKGVLWISSNSSVASVDNDNGIVIAKQPGTTVVTAVTKDGGYKAYCSITVTDGSANNIAVSNVKLNNYVLFMTKGKEATLNAAVYPTNATNKSVTWSSDNTKVATIDNNGKVLALNNGLAVITVTTKDGNFTDRCLIVVRDSENSCAQVLTLKLNKSSISIKEGKFEKLNAIITPANKKNIYLVWKSSDAKVAVVTSDGRVIAIKDGKAEITVTTKDGKYSAKCKVEVLKDKDKGKGKSKGHKK
jgi:uncharacterized protein YjdB